MPRRSVAPTTLLVAASLVVGACASSGDDEIDATGDDATQGAATLTVTAEEFAFTPAALTARSDFTLTLNNSGSMQHDIRVEDTDIMVEAAAGKSATSEAHLEAGDYTFSCSIPGHRDAGMEGSLTVR